MSETIQRVQGCIRDDFQINHALSSIFQCDIEIVFVRIYKTQLFFYLGPIEEGLDLCVKC